jgi:hypothetical protein
VLHATASVPQYDDDEEVEQAEADSRPDTMSRPVFATFITQ